MTDAGHIVHTLASIYGEQKAQDVADEEWLEYAGSRGLVVLAKDTRFRHRPVQTAAIINHRVRAFVLTNANLTGQEQNERILEHQHRIIKRARKPGPYLIGIYADRLDPLELARPSDGPSSKSGETVGRSYTSPPSEQLYRS